MYDKKQIQLYVGFGGTEMYNNCNVEQENKLLRVYWINHQPTISQQHQSCNLS